MSESLQFALSHIRDTGSARFNVEVPAEDYQDCLADNAILSGPLAVELDFLWRDGSYHLKGQINGEWEIACCRCLVPKGHPYRSTLEADYPAATSSVDVTEEVRQALILALPISVLCEPDCKGLCLRCGSNKNSSACRCRPETS